MVAGGNDPMLSTSGFVIARSRVAATKQSRIRKRSAKFLDCFPPLSRGLKASLAMTKKRSHLEHLLLGAVQAFGGTVAADEIIVADHREQRGGLIAGMDREVHVLLERHGLVEAHQRPFNQVVALPVAIEAQLRRQAARAHE